MPYPYSITTINKRSFEDPRSFASECEAIFNRKVDESAAMIAERLIVEDSHVVFLSGPSGSGKTTTARKICKSLENLGILAHTVSLDEYYKSPDPLTSPRDAFGEYDLESPYCLDLDMLNNHFDALDRGEKVIVPYFCFKSQTRDTSK